MSTAPVINPRLTLRRDCPLDPVAPAQTLARRLLRVDYIVLFLRSKARESLRQDFFVSSWTACQAFPSPLPARAVALPREGQSLASERGSPSQSRRPDRWRSASAAGAVLPRCTYLPTVAPVCPEQSTSLPVDDRRKTPCDTPASLTCDPRSRIMAASEQTGSARAAPTRVRLRIRCPRPNPRKGDV